jgi:hypothetical protein
VVILFLVFVLAMVGLIALAWALPLGTLASYGVALARVRSNDGLGTRLAVQLGVATLSVGLLTVAFVVLLFSLLSGNAGSGMRIFGRDVFDLVFLLPAFATPLIIVAGEVGLFALRRARQGAESGGDVSGGWP